jgi:hypothetical protein
MLCNFLGEEEKNGVKKRKERHKKWMNKVRRKLDEKWMKLMNG